jgi:Ca2+/Na+ antiporter
MRAFTGRHGTVKPLKKNAKRRMLTVVSAMIWPALASAMTQLLSLCYGMLKFYYMCVLVLLYMRNEACLACLASPHACSPHAQLAA